MSNQTESPEKNRSNAAEKPPEPKFKLPPNRPDNIFKIEDRKKPKGEPPNPVE